MKEPIGLVIPSNSEKQNVSQQNYGNIKQMLSKSQSELWEVIKKILYLQK